MFRTMKRLLIPVLASVSALVIILCILFFVTSNTDDNEIVTVYCVTKVKRDSPSKPLTQYTYDEKGRILEVINSKGKTVNSYSYDEYGNPTHFPYPGGGNAAATYDKNGNMLTLKRYYSDITKPNLENIYTYDRKGKLIETVSYSNGTPSITERNTYNIHGDLIARSREYASNNSVPNEYIRAEYDKNRNMIHFKMYYGELLRLHEEYAYDTAGRIIALTQIRDNKIASKREFVYDVSGRMIQMSTYFPEQPHAELPSYIVDFEYDLLGNLVKRTTTENGKQYISKWIYDSKGNLTSYDNGSSLIKWYYDSNGNIVKEESIYNYNNHVSSTEYTYEAFQVTRKEADFIKSQQKDIISLLNWDETPKTYLEILEMWRYWRCN